MGDQFTYYVSVSSMSKASSKVLDMIVFCGMYVIMCTLFDDVRLLYILCNCSLALALLVGSQG